jgi:hypothetical protein
MTNFAMRITSVVAVWAGVSLILIPAGLLMAIPAYATIGMALGIAFCGLGDFADGRVRPTRSMGQPDARSRPKCTGNKRHQVRCEPWDRHHENAESSRPHC